MVLLLVFAPLPTPRPQGHAVEHPGARLHVADLVHPVSQRKGPGLPGMSVGARPGLLLRENADGGGQRRHLGQDGVLQHRVVADQEVVEGATRWTGASRCSKSESTLCRGSRGIFWCDP